MKARRFAIGASTLALALAGLAVGAAPASAKPPAPFAASGSVSCSLTKGLIKITPGLTNTPTHQTTTVLLKASCSGTTGNPAVSVTSVVMKGGLNDPNPSTCATLVGEHPIPVALHAKWKALGGKIFESDIEFSSYNGGVSFTVPGPTGESSIDVGGSYGGEHASGSGAIAGFNPKADCSAKHPIKKITLGSGSVSVQPTGP